jgi:hypothetical protein
MDMYEPIAAMQCADAAPNRRANVSSCFKAHQQNKTGRSLSKKYLPTV